MDKVLKLAFKPADFLLNWPDKKNVFLEGLYAPVQEEISAQECEVLGELPEAISGVFARNGPNPKFTPQGGYHWFDGDGMIHGVRIKPSGKASFTNNYVKTKVLQAQEEEGQSHLFKIGDFGDRLGFPKFMLQMLKNKLGVVPDFLGMMESNANTSLEFHAGSLMALGEAGLPYALRVMCDGVFETVGSMLFDGEMKTPFTAHPKKDPSTGKLYGFGYQLDKKPYLTMYVLDADGKIERQFPVDLPRGSMMHDFAITENYAVFLDVPLVLREENVVKGTFPLVFDKTLGTRIGVLPLDATDASGIRWFDMPETFAMYHALNAWEEKVEVEGGTKNNVIKMITCDYFEFDLDQKEGVDESTPERKPQPYTNTLNLDTGKATRANLMPQPPKEGLEFPQLRRTLVGRKNRFGYFAGSDDEGFPTALVKVDLKAATPETAEVGRVDFGEWVGGEGIFIPSSKADDADEDDGFLVSFVSPKDGGNSELRVWDAKTMNPDPVAIVKLPSRVPLGFHAIFVSEADLATQKRE